MYQSNAAHTGYVPVTLDPARFAKAWEWPRRETAPAAPRWPRSPIRSTPARPATVISAARFRGSKRDAIAFAGGAFSGRASSSQEHDEQRVLSSFDLTSGDAEARMAVCRAGSPGFVGRSYALHCGPGDE